MIANSTVTGCRLVERDRIIGDSTLPSSWLAAMNTAMASTAVSGLTVSPNKTAGTAPITGPR